MKKIQWKALAIIAFSTAVNADTYYVDATNGLDTNTGRSHSQAWKSITKVNSYSFNTGDDVYLLSGGNWKKSLTVDWNGSATNRVIVGSYYMLNGVETIGVKPNTSKPTLTGTYPVIEVPSAVPPGRYAAMIKVKANYVTLQNLRVKNSAGAGITLDKAQHHAIFEKNEIDSTSGSAMLFQRQTYSNIMRNNKLHGCALGWRDKIRSGTWPICNGAVGSRNNVIENNLVTGSYGEGIVAYDVGSDNNIIRKNIIVVVRAVGIYVDNGANNLVESNIVVGDSTSDRNRGSAFGLNVEDYPNMKNATGNIFRNNLAANTQRCFWVGMEPDARSRGFKVGGSFIGNTCVGIDHTVSSFVGDRYIETLTVSNNIFAGMLVNTCNIPTGQRIKLSHNLWQVKAGDADCHGTGDVITNPKLTKTTGWANISPTNIPTANDFRPQTGSLAYQAGLANPQLLKDYFGKVRPTNPSVGAIDNGKSIKVPRPPTGVKIQ